MLVFCFLHYPDILSFKRENMLIPIKHHFTRKWFNVTNFFTPEEQLPINIRIKAANLMSMILITFKGILSLQICLLFNILILLRELYKTKNHTIFSRKQFILNTSHMYRFEDILKIKNSLKKSNLV